jgi:hypothetical protein
VVPDLLGRALPSASIASASRLYATLAAACEAMAPTPACAAGTMLPAEMTRDWMPMPMKPSAGSHATMLKVERVGAWSNAGSGDCA